MGRHADVPRADDRLAEALEAPVVDRGGRLNFPTDHYLNQSGRGSRLVREADVILGLELYDFWGSVSRIRDLAHRDEVRLARPDARLISLGVHDLFLKSNYQSFQRHLPVDLAGPRIAPHPPPFTRFARMVRHPPNVMPAYSRTDLSDRRLRRIHDYLDSIPEPPDVASIPALVQGNHSTP